MKHFSLNPPENRKSAGFGRRFFYFTSRLESFGFPSLRKTKKSALKKRAEEKEEGWDIADYVLGVYKTEKEIELSMSYKGPV